MKNLILWSTKYNNKRKLWKYTLKYKFYKIKRAPLNRNIDKLSWGGTKKNAIKNKNLKKYIKVVLVV